MRVAVIDMGTNSTRLLVADVEPDRIREVERRSTVTRLGRGVDTSGQLAAEAIEDVCAAVSNYIDIYRELMPERVTALATSAVRDAGNGSAFIAELRERFALDAKIIAGEEEARLTYLGASSGLARRSRPHARDRHRWRLHRAGRRLGHARSASTRRFRPGRFATPSATSPTTRRGRPSSRHWPTTSARSSTRRSGTRRW